MSPTAVRTAAEAKAAQQLIDHALACEIVLPLSSAHVVETARTGGRRRAHLATTMLELSRGWQMRNPLAVRHDELVRSMSGEAATAQDVFTLDPDVIFSSTARSSAARTASAEAQDNASGLPPGPFTRDLHRRLTNVSSLYDVMIEDEKTDSTAGRVAAAGWAQGHKDLALHFRETRKPKEHIRLASWAKVLADTMHDMATAGGAASLSEPAFDTWLNDAQRHVASMPYLGRLTEITWSRLSNADERWEPNDLNDMHYLACAAGYADIVAGENSTTHHLKRAVRHVPQGAAVCSTLAQAVASLTAG